MAAIVVDTTAWRPEQHNTGHAPTYRLTPGNLVIYERAPYRVVEVRERDHTDWPQNYLDRWRERHCPDPATWDYRPMVVVARHEPEPASEPLHLLAPGSHYWTLLPEHYAVCRLCGELPPCREIHTEAVMAVAAAKMEGLMAIMPGCCHSCREPVTRRQKTILFEGANLLRPDLTDDSVVFHLREACRWGAERYDARWAAADPERRRKLFCEGRARNHHDGSFDCTEDPHCPGRVNHRSEEWHTPGGERYTSGCWCVSGDLAGRLAGRENGPQ